MLISTGPEYIPYITDHISNTLYYLWPFGPISTRQKMGLGSPTEPSLALGVRQPAVRRLAEYSVPRTGARDVVGTYLEAHGT